jgi:hypothetical protein
MWGGRVVMREELAASSSLISVLPLLAVLLTLPLLETGSPRL